MSYWWSRARARSVRAMPGRTARRAGVILALAAALVAPASASAASVASLPWRLFDAPLTTSAADRFAVAAGADGAAAVLYREGSALRLAERAPGAAAFTRRTLADPAPAFHVAAVDAQGTRIAALLDDQGVRIVQSGGVAPVPAEQRVGVPGQVVALAALTDGSVLLAQGAIDQPAIRLWRRAAGGGAFVPMLSVGAGDPVTNDTLLLRATPDGGAALAFATQREALLGENPVTSPVSRVWTARVALLAPGAPAFDAAETAVQRESRTNVARPVTWESRVEDAAAGAGGRVDVGLREAQTFSTSEGTIRRVSAQVRSRSAAGAWSSATLTSADFAPGSGVVSAVRLARVGEGTMAGFVDVDQGAMDLRVARSADGFAARTLLAGATALRGLVAPGDGTALAVVDRSGGLSADVVSAAGTVLETAPVSGGTPSEAAVTADGAGAAVVAFGTSAQRAVAVRDAGAPVLRSVSVPATVMAGEPVTLSVDAADAWSAVTVAWDLGGGAAASGASVTRTFATPGTVPVTVTATDAEGHATSATRTVTVVAPAAPLPEPGAPSRPGTTPPGPGDPPPNGGPRDVTAPTLTAIRLSRTRFGAARGATLTWRVDERATVAFTLARAARGFRSGSRCVARAPRTGRRRPCTRWLAAGTLPARTGEGAGTLRVTGRVGRRTLAPGRYRLTLRATDGAGNRSSPRTVAFTITR